MDPIRSKADKILFVKKNSEIIADDHKNNPVVLIRNNWHLDHLSEEWPNIKLSNIKEQNNL